MIIATVTAIMILMGGVGFSFGIFHEAARETIDDPVRVAQLEEITDRADDVYKAIFKDIEKHGQIIAEMSKRYDLTRQEMRDQLQLIDIKNDMHQETFIALRYQAKARVSREEWEAMYKEVEKRK